MIKNGARYILKSSHTITNDPKVRKNEYFVLKPFKKTKRIEIKPGKLSNLY